MLRRCIVLFAQDALGEGDDAKDHDRDPERYGALDEIAEGGTSGLLAWRRSRGEGAPFPSEREQIAQVLGLWGDARGEESEDPTTTLREEYKGAECHLLTNSRDARDAFASAFAKSEVYGSASPDPDGPPSTSADLLSALDKSLRDEADLVFVHLLLAPSSEEEDGTPSSDPLGALNKIVRRILDAHADDSTLLVVIAADGQNQGSNEIESLTRGETKATEGHGGAPSLAPYVPRQSFEFSRGRPIDDWCSRGLAYAVHYSRGLRHVRRDGVIDWSAGAALRRGGNKVTLAQDFLKGPMFSISKAAKYGA